MNINYKINLRMNILWTSFLSNIALISFINKVRHSFDPIAIMSSLGLIPHNSAGLFLSTYCDYINYITSDIMYSRNKLGYFNK